jgi:hypothetical protein
MTEIQIKVGQIWGDCDSRRPKRYLQVVSMTETRVIFRDLRTGHASGVHKSRIKPGRKGYFLAMDPEVVAEVQKLLFEANLRPPPQYKPQGTTGQPEVLPIPVRRLDKITGT